MVEKLKIWFYIILLPIYIAGIILVTGFGALFLGFADYVLIIFFGIVNSFISGIFFKTPFFKSLIIGFLVSSSGLIFSYLLWIPFSNHNFSDYIFMLAICINAIVQATAWIFVKSSLIHTTRLKTVLLFSTTLLMVLISFHMWEYWRYEKYYNNHNKVSLQVKFIDSETGQALIGDSVTWSTQKQPLYGIMHTNSGSYIPDEKGTVTFKIFKGNNYWGDIYIQNRRTNIFDIEPKHIIENETIEIMAERMKKF